MRLTLYKLSLLLLLFIAPNSLGQESVQPPTPEKPEVEYFGWIPHHPPKNYKSTPYDAQLKKLVQYNDGKNAFLYRYLYQAKKDSDQLSQEEKQTNRLDSLNQGSVGSCVGFASARTLDVLMAANVFHRQQLLQVWLSRSHPPAIYAIGRMENQGGWDGSTGIWSVEGLSKYGTLHRLKYNSYDLSEVDQLDARTWARSGLPGNLLEDAKEHKLIAYAAVTNTDEAQAAISNGYPVLICAQASYTDTRDKDGFSRSTGKQWAHAMCVVAYRGTESGKEGFLIQNSWGNQWNSGSLYPDDMPWGSFWVTPKDLQFHLSQGDSFAMTTYHGFERKRIDWKDVWNFNQEITD